MVSMLIFPKNRFFRHFDFIVFSTQIAPKKSNASKIFFISGRKKWVFDHFLIKKALFGGFGNCQWALIIKFSEFQKIEPSIYPFKWIDYPKKIRNRIHSLFKKILTKLWRAFNPVWFFNDLGRFFENERILSRELHQYLF